MNPVTSFIKRYPQIIFWGIAWSTSFFGYYMSVIYPSPLWLFFVWGPFLGGALITAIAEGWGGLKTYFSRIVRWRVGLKWYAVALFLPLVIRLAALGLNILSGATVPTNIQWPVWTDLLGEYLFIFLIIGLGEEPGFRGFALPRLLAGRSALTASLLLGVLHTIWHLPLIVTGEEPPTIILIILSGAFLFTWLFNQTNGSVLIAMLFHASVNLWVPHFNALFSGAEAARYTIWELVVYVAAALILVAVAGPNLTHKPEPVVHPVGSTQLP